MNSSFECSQWKCHNYFPTTDDQGLADSFQQDTSASSSMRKRPVGHESQWSSAPQAFGTSQQGLSQYSQDIFDQVQLYPSVRLNANMMYR